MHEEMETMRDSMGVANTEKDTLNASITILKKELCQAREEAKGKKDSVSELETKVEEAKFLGEEQGGFRRGRQTEDNLFVLDRVLEVYRGRGRDVWLGFVDLEKAYDGVCRRKLFEVLRQSGCGEWLRAVEEIYSENEVVFSWGGRRTWAIRPTEHRPGDPAPLRRDATPFPRPL